MQQQQPSCHLMCILKSKEITGIEIATTVYPFDLYNHEYGNKCAPNTMAYTIIIFSGTALNTHITINK